MEYVLVVGIVVVLAAAFIVPISIFASRRRKRVLDALFGAIPKNASVHESIRNYWDAFSECYPDQAYIDRTTWNDLDMDAVFCRINGCLSSVGEEYLFALLHRPANAEILSQRENLVACLEKRELRLKIQLVLNRLGKNRFNGLWILMFAPHILSLGSYKRYLIQALLPLLGVALLFVNSSLGIVVLALTLLANIITFAIAKNRSEQGLEHVSYLVKTLHCAKGLEKELSGSCPQYAQDMRTSLAHFKKLSFSSFMIAATPNSDADALISLFGMLTLAPVIQYCKSIQLLTDRQKELQEFFALVGEVDAALSLASFRASLEYYSQPTFSQTLTLEGRALYHPLVQAAVPNDVLVEKNLLLTGSNASGKSTYIKSIAVNALLAQTCNTCCAESFSLKRAPIITSMGVSDNIIGGESYFVVEIKSMKRIVQAAIDDLESYCFIDEILKGTNTTERIAASAAVLRFLHQKACICVAATHDLELTEMLSAEYLNRHFSEQITDAGMLFDYQLKEGPSQSKNAIKLLSHFDYPKAVVAYADELVIELEAEKQR
ncbi:MAG: hypothetical protein LBU48_02800 [Coriobacteriales bacterium]|jgi:hypothetical protein|nr:hypothetical protein [Coriobacteriales bacterium]